MRLASWARAKVALLLRAPDSPHAIALGVSLGLFFGLSPLWGFKTLFALGLTRLLKGSVLAAAVTLALHEALLPALPMIFRWDYDVGYWLLSQPHAFPPRLRLLNGGASIWFQWSTLARVGRPLLLGSAVMTAPVAVLSYYATLRWMLRHRGREGETGHQRR